MTFEFMIYIIHNILNITRVEEMLVETRLKSALVFCPYIVMSKCHVHILLISRNVSVG